VARRSVEPLERFLRTEVGGGVVLLVAGLAALVWSNVAIGDGKDTVRSNCDTVQ
jgi:hypothetical protein